MFDVELEWIAAERYELDESPRGVAIHPVQNGTLRRLRPLKNSTLYAEFLALSGSPQACLDFANKYGLLIFNAETAPDYYEDVFTWRHFLNSSRQLKLASEGGNSWDPEKLWHKPGARPGALLLYGKVAMHLRRERVGPPTLELNCTSLLSAIEIQCVKAGLGGQRVYQCLECSSHFEVGQGAHRSHAIFCSRKCKDRHHNRRKKEARVKARSRRPECELSDSPIRET